MTRVINPYLKIENCPVRKVEFHASKEDLHELQCRLPRHGIKDAVFSALFFKFMKDLKANIPVATSAEEAELNEQRVHDFIQTIKFHA
jgi:hypothetical protein